MACEKQAQTWQWTDSIFLENGFLCNTRKKLLKGSSSLFIEKVF